MLSKLASRAIRPVVADRQDVPFVGPAFASKIFQDPAGERRLRQMDRADRRLRQVQQLEFEREIGVIRFDRPDGRPLALLFHYGCHPLLGVPDGRVTANFPGIACRRIEEALGEGATALFLQGCGGDVIELNFKDFSGPRSAEAFGAELGWCALRARRGVQTGVMTLDAVRGAVSFPRRSDIPARLAELRAEEEVLLRSLRFTTLNFKGFMTAYLKERLFPEYPAAEATNYLHEAAVGADALRRLDAFQRRNVAKYLDNIRAMEELARLEDRIATYSHHQREIEAAGGAPVETELLAFRLGDGVILSNPTELLAAVGLKVKNFSPFPHTLVAAYSNGYLHYGAPAAACAGGGYEVTECLLAPEWEEIFLAEARGLLDRLWERVSPLPAGRRSGMRRG